MKQYIRNVRNISAGQISELRSVLHQLKEAKHLERLTLEWYCCNSLLRRGWTMEGLAALLGPLAKAFLREREAQDDDKAAIKSVTEIFYIEPASEILPPRSGLVSLQRRALTLQRAMREKLCGVLSAPRGKRK